MIDRGELSTAGPQRSVTFDEYEIIPRARLLLRAGEPILVGSRAFDLLLILARHRGQLVPKQAIIDFVWPSVFVDESNLRFQMSLLRKVLGRRADLIKTIPGRGYLLAIDVPASSGRVLAVLD